MLKVKAGRVVDTFIDMVVSHLDEGGPSIDGGNSHYPNTIRRTKTLAEKARGTAHPSCPVAIQKRGRW